MTTTPTAYQPLISARSRRLRMTGVLLLVAILGMALYGYAILMPSMRALPHVTQTIDRAGSVYRTGSANRADSKGTARSGSSTAARDAASNPVKPLTEKQRKTALAKVLFVYGYWSVCGLLLVALILVSWLDFRELSRNYGEYRRRLYAESLRENATREGN
jgi:hypothetical protein